MNDVEMNGIAFTGNPCRKVTATWNGATFTAGERTWAHLFMTQRWIDEHYPRYYIYVVQGAYNTGVKLSAGTHDGDGTIDALIIDRETGERLWRVGQRILRRLGWAAWWRNSGAWERPTAWHFHMNSLGTAESGCPVGVFIPGQNRDYLAVPPRNGLAGHDRDRTWHPSNIEDTVFDFRAWLTREKLMAKLDVDDLVAVRKIVAEEIEKSWKKVQTNGRRRSENLTWIARKVGVSDIGDEK